MLTVHRAQQGTYAIESVMDELARKLELDLLEFRLQNCVVEGDPRPNGKRRGHGIGTQGDIGSAESASALAEPQKRHDSMGEVSGSRSGGGRVGSNRRPQFALGMA